MFWCLVLLAAVAALHFIPAIYIYDHCRRAHSRYSWIKFLSEAPEIREEMQELSFVPRYCQLYMLWLSLKLTKLFSGVNPEIHDSNSWEKLYGND